MNPTIADTDKYTPLIDNAMMAPINPKGTLSKINPTF